MTTDLSVFDNLYSIIVLEPYYQGLEFEDNAGALVGGWAKETKEDVKVEEEEGLAVENLDQICEQGLVVKKEK